MRDGSVIKTARMYLVVDDPCSGIRSLIALIALGVIFALGVGVVILTAGIQRMLSTLNTRLTGAPSVSPILSAVVEQVKASIAEAATKNSTTQ